jgi:Alpha/beta hydrolase family
MLCSCTVGSWTVGVAGRVRPAEGRRFHRERRAEPDHLARGRRGRHQDGARRPDGPAILVGHSYGGAVITEAGMHEKVAALVYISAFAPDKEESVNTLISGFPSGGRYRRSCRPRMGSCFSIAESSRHHSQLICPRSNRRSWPNRRSHGASTPYPKRSRTQLGGRSRAGISSPPTTT